MKAQKKLGKKAVPRPEVPLNGPVPVTLLSGFLGAGKTTLLEHILRNKEGLRCAVIVNDMAEINIDASLVKGSKLLQKEEKMVELHNGCICCTLREDLLIELKKLALSNTFDVIVIESTGVSEPMQVAETFFMDVKGSGILNNIARLDNCVTVVDATTFYDHLNSLRNVSEMMAAAMEPNAAAATPAAAAAMPETDEDDRNISHLLIDQVEFANLILLNKMDQVPKERVEQTLLLLKHLAPQAKIVCTTKSVIDLQLVLFTDQFSEAFAEKAKGWMADITSGVKHVPETLEYGIGSFVYRSDRPFHPKRLHDFMTSFFMLQEIDGEEEDGDASAAAASPPTPVEPATASDASDEAQRQAILVKNKERATARLATLGNVFRSKGYAWIGSPARLGSFAEWNQAGNLLTFTCGGGWGLFPETAARPGMDKEVELVEKAPSHEIVFIGQDLKRDAIVALLDRCLITSEEQQRLEAVMEQATEVLSAAVSAQLFGDPFEPWSTEDAWEDAEDSDADDA